MKTCDMNNLNHFRTLAARLRARISHTRKEPLINTWALPSWKDSDSTWELFQQFVESCRKPWFYRVGVSP